MSETPEDVLTEVLDQWQGAEEGLDGEFCGSQAQRDDNERERSQQRAEWLRRFRAALLRGTPVAPPEPPVGQGQDEARQDSDETASDQNPCK